MTSLMLFDDPRAPSPRRVRMFLAEKGIEVPMTPVNLGKGEHFSDEFRALNPDCTVPALRLPDGRAITDSYAICGYFEAVHPDPPLMGRDPAERAITEAWARKIELEAYQSAALFLRHTHPRFEGRSIPGVREGFPQVPAMGEHAKRVLDRLLVRVDAPLATQPFIVSEVYGIADIMLQCALDFGTRMEPTLPPNVARWYEEVSARPCATA